MSDSVQALALRQCSGQALVGGSDPTPWRFVPQWRDTVSVASPEARSLSHRALQRALIYIEANIGERFSLEMLADAAGISRFHFARLFRVATGYSPMEFLMRQRVERGRLILLHGEMSICDIAALLGFCDQSHFTRTFRRVMGMSPREYVHKCTDA